MILYPNHSEPISSFSTGGSPDVDLADISFYWDCCEGNRSGGGKLNEQGGGWDQIFRLKFASKCDLQVLSQCSRLLSMLTSLWEDQEERNRMAMHYTEETFIQVLLTFLIRICLNCKSLMVMHFTEETFIQVQGYLFVIFLSFSRHLKIRLFTITNWKLGYFSVSPTEKSVTPKPSTVY